MGLGVALLEFLFATTLAVYDKQRKDSWGKTGVRAEEGLFVLE